MKKNEVHIKSVYMMSSEFELRSGKPMLKTPIAGGSYKREGLAIQVEITNWGSAIVWNG